MYVIMPRPYQPYKGQKFNDTTISIEIGAFNQFQAIKGTTTFAFLDCVFPNLIIRNPDKIPHDDLSIAFFNCVIGNIEVNEIETENLSLGFYGCFFQGRISAPKLTGVEVSNSIVSNGLFLIDQRNIRINISEANLRLLELKKMTTFLNMDVAETLSRKQSYFIHDPESLLFEIDREKSKRPGIQRTPYVFGKRREYIYVFSDDQWKNADLNLTVSFKKEVANQKIEVLRGHLNSLSISGKTSGTISIEDTTVNKMYLYDFIPKGPTSFFGINPLLRADSKIGIHKCNLDDVSFDNVRFDHYERISLYRSKLAKAVFTSCDFPSKYKSFKTFLPIENVHYPEKTTQNHHKDQYEIFLQLKMALESTGNFYEAQKWQSLSHEALKRVPTITGDDRTILNINESSNKHGTSISRPLWWFLGCSVSFYLLYLFSVDRLFTSTEFDSTLIGYYFTFIDITHRADFLVEKTAYTWFSLTIDGLSKLINGFFIYQFVAAFRKYGKR